ncbi:HTH_Tnp_Tc3_2 domain-containing protein [Trichonephila clavipes]|nr:HTH_Tnp_Tc3_2 domain-containing protein [Trichonephila clavipes]
MHYQSGDMQIIRISEKTIRICDRWMQKATTDRRGRSHPPQFTTSRENRQIVCMAVTNRSVSSRTIAHHIESVTHQMVGFESGDTEKAPSTDLSPIESMWSMVAQRLTQITLPAATPDQFWQRVEAAWSAVSQENIKILFESMSRRVAAVISNNGGYSVY